MFPAGDHLAIEPHAHIAVTPLACNQVPIVFQFGFTLHKEMLVVVVLLEIEFAILVEEMDAGSIVTHQGPCLLVVEVFVRAEPEFHRTDPHGINQVHTERRHLTIVQLESVPTNTLHLFTFIEQRFKFIQITGVFIHCEGRGRAMAIDKRRHVNDRSIFALRKRVEIPCYSKFIYSGPHSCGIVFLIDKRTLI